LTRQLIRGTGLGGGIGSILYTEGISSLDREYFLYNVIGSVVVTANADASVKSTKLYEAFGKVIASTGSSDNNRLFCTKERSASIGLDNFGFRYFDWEIGRFIQRDPSGYPDGLNNYLYCSNNPINRIDPLGLKSHKDKGKFKYDEDSKRYVHDDDKKHLDDNQKKIDELEKKKSEQNEKDKAATDKKIDEIKKDSADLNKQIDAYQVHTFKGYEDDRFQKHDEQIMTHVRDFNRDIKKGIDGTDVQAESLKNHKKGGYLKADLVKAYMIQESGGDPKQWDKDPMTVNHPGKDWNENIKAKKALGLKDPTNKPYPSGNFDDNLDAAIRFLARKGFGASGNPTKLQPDYRFEGWEKAAQRYGPGTDAHWEKIQKIQKGAIPND